MAYSDTLPARVVFFSYPAAGTEIPLGAPVNLMVNRGRATNFTYMPKVVGMPLLLPPCSTPSTTPSKMRLGCSSLGGSGLS